jgi:hypothetical protein
MNFYLPSILFPGHYIRISPDIIEKIINSKNTKENMETINKEPIKIEQSEQSEVKERDFTILEKSEVKERDFSILEKSEVKERDFSILDKRIMFDEILNGRVHFSNFEKINKAREFLTYEKWTQFFSKFDSRTYFIALERKFKIKSLTITIIKALLADNYVNTYGYLEFLLLEKYIENKMKLDKETIILLLRTTRHTDLVDRVNKCSKLSDIKKKFFINVKECLSNDYYPEEVTNLTTGKKETIMIQKNIQVKHYFFDHVPIINSSAKIFLDYINKFNKQLI